ncbi:methyl jasmonate esterase 1-like isoform X3 [Malania oleifera]|uniref:methyl jasmonate esterase 1-like isoform X3 n=1 Tax=Malania oleifera TaxID=397392 RepID=UPI0025AE08E8|nr:methyl jasmonate esterase 1-like isoform X3 [Malania oleifera]
MMVMEKIMRKKHLVASIALFIFLSFTLLLHKAESSRAAAGGGKHFVLVHGAGHGAWCWFKLVPLLRSYGHNVTTMDLAASGIDPRQLEDVRSTSDYFQPLTDFMAALPPSERVVLVAHSYGGIGISLAMERFPEKIAVAVFVTALMPGPSQNITELANRVMSNVNLLDSFYIYGNGPTNPPTALVSGPKTLARNLYQLSRVETFGWAPHLGPM